MLDVLVLDKITGNARVGYGNVNGTLTWSAPLTTGVGGAAGCAVGRLLYTTRDAVAVTAAALNCDHLVDLSGTNTAGTPMIVTPQGLGPTRWWRWPIPWAVSRLPTTICSPRYSDNNDSAELLDLTTITAGVGPNRGNTAKAGRSTAATRCS